MRNARIAVCLAFVAGLLAVQAASAAGPFAKAMNRVCSAANHRVATVGVSESLYELTANEPRLLASDKTKVAGLVGLGRAPTGVAAPFARYLALQRQIDGLGTEMISAAKHVHLSTVEQLLAQSGLLQKKQDAAARKIGAAACLSTAP